MGFYSQGRWQRQKHVRIPGVDDPFVSDARKGMKQDEKVDK